MWGCNWGPSFHFSFVGVLINILMVVTIVYMVVLTIRSFFAKGSPNKDAVDSLEIIKAKFARGEISEEEYQRMKEILTG